MIDTPSVAEPEASTAKASTDDMFGTDHIKQDIGRRTVRGGAVTVVYQILKQSLALGETIVMSRLLLPEQSGLVNMVIIFTDFIVLFSDLGLSSATVQRETIDHDKVNTLFWINVGLGVLLSVITAAMAPVIAAFYSEPRLLAITLAMAAGFFFGGLTVQHRALLKRQLRITPLVIVDLVATIVGIATAIITALLLPSDQRYWAILAGILAQLPVEIAGLWMVCRWRPTRPAVAKDVRSMIAFGGNLTGYQVINYFARNIDNLLIGKFFGPAAVGLYNKAYALLLLPLRRVHLPISQVAEPALSRLVSEPERYRYAYRRIASMACLITMPLIAFMMMSSEWLIPFVLGRQWSEASLMFTLLGISGIVEPFVFTTSWLFVTQGRGQEQLRWGFISTTITILAILAGMPWGPVGVAAAYGLSGLLRTPLLFWYIGRNGIVRTRDLYRYIAPFLVTAGSILLALGTLRLFLSPASQSTDYQLFMNLVIATVLAGVVTLVTLFIQPAGRAAIKDVRAIPALLRNRNA